MEKRGGKGSGEGVRLTYRGRLIVQTCGSFVRIRGLNPGVSWCETDKAYTKSGNTYSWIDGCRICSSAEIYLKLRATPLRSAVFSKDNLLGERLQKGGPHTNVNIV